MKHRPYSTIIFTLCIFLTTSFVLEGCDTMIDTSFPATEYYTGAQLPLAQAIEKGDLAAVELLAPQRVRIPMGGRIFLYMAVRSRGRAAVSTS